ncbi:AFC1 [Symbiodinium sp. CCMP2592]|nr:AFC1 [Symbiodinium sp. CCMP2592]
MRLEGAGSGASYVVEDYVASGSFSRVFRVRREVPGVQEPKRRWGNSSEILAAKVMRKEDAYIQYTSSGPGEGELLQRLEAAQREASAEVLTMRCVESFATKDDAGKDYWCLILEWLDASLFDVLRMNGNRGLHLSMVRVMLTQLLQQLKVLQGLGCTHTDIKHKNCCLASTEHYMASLPGGGSTMILTDPVVKFIDYGNAVFEGQKKPHPIHTKQFRAPEVLLNIRGGWGPASDTWTLGVTGAFLVSGQLIFNSHDPQELIRLMVQALGPFPDRLLGDAQDARLRRLAESAMQEGKDPQLAQWLGLAGQGPAAAACADLLRRMLALDPKERITAEDALRHPFIVEGGAGETATVPPRSPRTSLSRPSPGGKGGR